MQGLMQDTPLSLRLILERAGSLHGHKTVTTTTAEGLRRRTYADVVDRSARLANALMELGVRPSDRVATFAWNSDRHLEAYLAVPCMGAVLHTLNIRLHPAQLSFIANHAADVVALIDASAAEAWSTIEGLETVREVVVMDDIGLGSPGDSGIGAAHDYETLLAGSSPDFAWPRLDENAAAAMCYTSGTTGEPKGVVYSHRSATLHSIASLAVDTLGLGEHDVAMPIVPQFHANAWGVPYTAMLAGASLAMPSRFMDPERTADLVEQAQVTMSAAVPTVWQGMLQAIQGGQIDPARLRSLERIVIGGSAVPETLMHAYDELGIPIVHAWGMTETSPLGSVASLKSTIRPEDELRVRLTQGLPSPTLAVRIVDSEERIAPWDGTTAGELQISGPWIADAYYDPTQPDLRGGHDAFVTDADGTRWLRTGDVATVDPEGYIKLVDRTKDLIKSGGEWISSVQLENLLMAHADIAEAAVIAAPDPTWGERPLACIVPAPDTQLDETELRDHLAEHVANWELPDAFKIIDEVPKTSVGKFDKKVLRDRYSR